MEITYEDGFDPKVLDELKTIGHRLQRATPSTGFGAIAAISKRGDVIEAVSDYRRSGCVSVF